MNSWIIQFIVSSVHGFSSYRIIFSINSTWISWRTHFIYISILLKSTVGSTTSNGRFQLGRFFRRFFIYERFGRKNSRCSKNNKYKFCEKKNIIPSPLMKKDPVQFHRFFLFFLWAKKERQIQKNILTGNGNRTYGESRDRDDRLRGTTVWSVLISVSWEIWRTYLTGPELRLALPVRRRCSNSAISSEKIG